MKSRNNNNKITAKQNETKKTINNIFLEPQLSASLPLESILTCPGGPPVPLS